MTVIQHREQRWGLALLLLALPFYLNDFAFVALQSNGLVYLFDWVHRLAIILLAFAMPFTRRLVLEKPATRAHWPLILAAIFILPFVSKAMFHLLEKPFIEFTGITGLFFWPYLENPAVYWFDLTVGLALGAITEELVFRKIAVNWIETKTQNVWVILLVPATLFSLMHWGSGPGRLIYTFVAGLLYTMMYLKIRRIGPLILAHYAENFMAFGPFSLDDIL